MILIETLVNFFGVVFFKGGYDTHFKIINMHLLIEIRHSILRQYHENYIGMRKIQFYILKNCSKRYVGVLRDDFWGFGCPNDAQTLGKTHYPIHDQSDQGLWPYDGKTEILKIIKIPKSKSSLSFCSDCLSHTLYSGLPPACHSLSQYLETGCPNRGFIDLCVSKLWYKVHTTNKINPIYLQILLFYASNCFVCLIKVTLQLLHRLSSKKNNQQQILTKTFWVSKLSKSSVLGVQMTRWTYRRLSPAFRTASCLPAWRAVSGGQM